jgi:hypothetical protein
MIPPQHGYPLFLDIASLFRLQEKTGRVHDVSQAKPRPKGAAEVPLVVYVLLESGDEANEANLRYYVREAIREEAGCTHIILVDPKRVTSPKTKPCTLPKRRTRAMSTVLSGSTWSAYNGGVEGGNLRGLIVPAQRLSAVIRTPCKHR